MGWPFGISKMLVRYRSVRRQDMLQSHRVHLVLVQRIQIKRYNDSCRRDPYHARIVVLVHHLLLLLLPLDG